MSKAAATHPLLGCCEHLSMQDPAKVYSLICMLYYGVAACPMLPLMSDLKSSALQLSMQDSAKVHCFSQMQQARSVCRRLTQGLTYKGVEEA